MNSEKKVKAPAITPELLAYLRGETDCSDELRPATPICSSLFSYRKRSAFTKISSLSSINSRIIKTISKGVVLIISPFLKKLYCRSSYLLYNQNKHCGFVSIKLQHDCSEVTQTTVTCLNW